MIAQPLWHGLSRSYASNGGPGIFVMCGVPGIVYRADLLLRTENQRTTGGRWEQLSSLKATYPAGKEVNSTDVIGGYLSMREGA
jgi:hypothetical protein